MSKLAEIQKKREEIKALRAEVEELSKESFKEGFQALFEKHDELVGATWAQYTPYFNDGDECIFGLGDVYFVPATKEESSNRTILFPNSFLGHSFL